MPAEAPVISVTRSVTYDLYFIARIGGPGGQRGVKAYALGGLLVSCKSAAGMAL